MLCSAASLQNLCLLKLVKYLEHYPPEFLACLPPNLRRKLLILLPVIDVCQLENTCVFDGVDVSTIWKARFEKQLSRYLNTIADGYTAIHSGLTLSRHLYSFVNKPNEFLDRYETVKEKYLSAITFAIFERARLTGHYYGEFVNLPEDESASEDVLDVSDIDLRKNGLLDHPADIVNYLVAASKVEEFYYSRESTYETTPSDESTNIDQCIRLDLPIPQYELEHVSVTSINYDSYKKVSKLLQYVPPRYSLYVNSENHYRLSDEDALTLLIEKCGYYARNMHINAARYDTIQWKWDRERVISLIGQFFSKSFSLELCLEGNCYYESPDSDDESIPCDPIPAEALDRILEGIFSSSSHQPFSLIISGVNDDDCLPTICQYLRKSVIANRIEKFTFKFASSLVNVMTNDLGSVLVSLSYLSSLELGYKHTGRYPVEMSSFSQFVTGIVFFLQQPHFKDLVLNKCVLTVEIVRTVISVFLKTPCQHDQYVALRVCIGGGVTEVANDQNLSIPDSALKNKALNLCVLSDSDHGIITWLLSLQPLKLECLDINCHPKLLENINMLALAANNTALHVSRLYLNKTSLSPEHFGTILHNETITEIKLVFGNEVELDDITFGLEKQKSLGSIRHINLVSFAQNETSTSIFGYVKPPSMFEIKNFCDALFSISGLNQLHFEISIMLDQDSDITGMVETISKSWKERSKGQRLKEFILHLVSQMEPLPILDEHTQCISREIRMKILFIYKRLRV